MAASSSSLCNFLSFTTLAPSQTKFPPSHLRLSPKSHKPRTTTTSLVVSSAQQQQQQSVPTSAAVTCPSLANANVMLFRSAYNVQVIVDEGESEERLLNRFRREVMRAGVIQEVKRRRYFENSQDEKKRRTRDAAKRNKRRRTFSRPPLMQNRQEVPVQKKSDEDEDNWDMPQGDIPY